MTMQATLEALALGVLTDAEFAALEVEVVVLATPDLAEFDLAA